MTVVLFEPHADDSVLFSCYTLLRESPLVITVLGGGQTAQENFGVYAEQRAHESFNAMESLGVQWMRWYYSEREPDWDAVGGQMELLDGSRIEIERVWAPLEEDGGHDQHNEVGMLAREVFGNRARFYATYRRGSGRTRTDNEVKPEPDWYAKKLKAMSCYTSQINLDNTRPWFSDWDREWIA